MGGHRANGPAPSHGGTSSMTASHLTDLGSRRKRHVPTKFDHIYYSVHADGTKMWVGWERGATPGVTAPSGFGEGINRYWVHRDPIFNWRTISEAQFLTEQRNLTKQFSQYIGSDSTNLHTFKGSGGKMLVAYGNADQVIPPNGHYNYMQRFTTVRTLSELPLVRR